MVWWHFIPLLWRQKARLATQNWEKLLARHAGNRDKQNMFLFSLNLDFFFSFNKCCLEWIQRHLEARETWGHFILDYQVLSLPCIFFSFLIPLRWECWALLLIKWGLTLNLTESQLFSRSVLEVLHRTAKKVKLEREIDLRNSASLDWNPNFVPVGADMLTPRQSLNVSGITIPVLSLSPQQHVMIFLTSRCLEINCMKLCFVISPGNNAHHLVIPCSLLLACFEGGHKTCQPLVLAFPSLHIPLPSVSVHNWVGFAMVLVERWPLWCLLWEPCRSFPLVWCGHGERSPCQVCWQNLWICGGSVFLKDWAHGRGPQYSSLWRTEAHGEGSCWRSSWRTFSHERNPTRQQGKGVRSSASEEEAMAEKIGWTDHNSPFPSSRPLRWG